MASHARVDIDTTSVQELVDLGFEKHLVLEALQLSSGDVVSATEVLVTWQRVPPPTVQETAEQKTISTPSPRKRSESIDLRSLFAWKSPRTPHKETRRASDASAYPMATAAGIAEEATSWLKVNWKRKSVELGSLAREAEGQIKSVMDNFSLGELPRNHNDTYAEFFEYPPDESPAMKRANEKFVHLPDQDADVGIVEASAPESFHMTDDALASVAVRADDALASVAVRAERAWGALRSMSALIPEQVVAGIGGVGCDEALMKHTSSKNVRWHASTLPGRCAEINALLSQGWMPPESVRRLKQELRELEERVRVDGEDHAGTPALGTADTGTPSATSAENFTPVSASCVSKGEGAPAVSPGRRVQRACTMPLTPSLPAASETLAGPDTGAQVHVPPAPGSPSALAQQAIIQRKDSLRAQGVSPHHSSHRIPHDVVEECAVEEKEKNAGAVNTSTVPAPNKGNDDPSRLPPPCNSEAMANMTLADSDPKTTKGTLAAPSESTSKVGPNGGILPPPPENETAVPVKSPTASVCEKGHGKGTHEKTPGKGKAPPPPRLSGKGGSAEASRSTPPESGAEAPAKSPATPECEKGSGKGAGKKGSGKGKPPPPPKGAGGPPPKTSKDAAPPKNPLFGRRFDMKVLPKEKTVGTVFATLSTAEVTVDVACLRALFEKPKAPPQAPKTKGEPKALCQVTLLSQQRAQNIMIALKRQPYTDAVAKALEDFNVNSEALTPEKCQVLMGAMPTPEEAQQLLNYKGDPQMLRETERQLLPIARLQRPIASQRLRLAVFGRVMAELLDDVRGGLGVVRQALIDARDSSSFRVVLSHVSRLASVINFGVSQAEGAVAGFALDALPKLILFKSANNPRVTLMHVLVAQVTAVDQELPMRVLSEVGSVRAAAQRCIAPLAEDVNAFCQEAENVAKCSSSCVSDVAPGADDVATRVMALANLAQSEARVLKEELSTTRDTASETLQFFVVNAKLHEVDAKALELCALLADFLASFDRCRQELASNPQLAAVCHQGAPGPAP